VAEGGGLEGNFVMITFLGLLEGARGLGGHCWGVCGCLGSGGVWRWFGRRGGSGGGSIGGLSSLGLGRCMPNV